MKRKWHLIGVWAVILAASLLCSCGETAETPAEAEPSEPAETSAPVEEIEIDSSAIPEDGIWTENSMRAGYIGIDGQKTCCLHSL